VFSRAAALAVAAAFLWVRPVLADEAPAAPPPSDEAQPAVAAPDVPVSGNAYEELAVLTEALMLIRRHYVEELSYRDILYGALDGMLQSLDPHSHFMPPEVYTEFQEDTDGTFCGVGVELGVRDGMLTVIAPIDGSPAYRAGIIAGDRIVKIAGEEAYDFSIREAAESIRGKAGESVVLTLARAGREPFDVTLVREQIVVSSVRGARLLKPTIGYIRLTQFDEQTMPAFRDKVDGLRREGMKALVLDLRSNPGGLLNVATQVAEVFLERGKTIVSVKGRSTLDKPQELKAGGVKPLTSIPLAVLLDEGSASASEVVAGALRDHHRAVLVGQKSFGKASVQTVVPLRSNPECGLRLTTAHYYTPAGHMIHGKGITPDIEVPVTTDERVRMQLRRAYAESPEMFPEKDRKDVANAADVALDRAVDVLAAPLAIGSN
jgi:carboxyl-terminal processing protease